MKEYKADKLMVDDRLLAENARILVERTEDLRATVSQIKSISEQMHKNWDGKASDAFYLDFVQDIACVEEFLQVSQKTIKDYDFALRIYKENKQKAADVIRAINI